MSSTMQPLVGRVRRVGENNPGGQINPTFNLTLPLTSSKLCNSELLTHAQMLRSELKCSIVLDIFSITKAVRAKVLQKQNPNNFRVGFYVEAIRESEELSLRKQSCIKYGWSTFK